MALVYTYNGVNGYIVENTGALIPSAYGGAGTYIVEIPSTFNGPQGNLPVVQIKSSGFKDSYYYYNGIPQTWALKLSNNITGIGKEAFYSNTKLMAVTTEGSIVNSTSYQHPKGNNSLFDSTFPTGLRRVGSFAFYSCHSLRISGFPDNLREFECGAFIACHGITGINGALTFNQDITLGSQVFGTCAGLNEVYFNKSYNPTGIPVPSAFLSEGFNFSTSTIKSIYINSGWVGPYDFFMARSLSKVTLGNNVKGITFESFDRCTNLSELNFANSSITGIEFLSFSECPSLKNINLPNSVKRVRCSAFAYNNIDTINFGSNMQELSVDSFANSTVKRMIFNSAPPTIVPCGGGKPISIDAVYYNNAFESSWSGVTGFLGVQPAPLHSKSEFNIALPYTGFGLTDFKILPAEISRYKVYDTKSVTLGLDHIGNCQKQAYSLLLGGTSHQFKQDEINYPWNPQSTRSTAGPGTGVGSAIIGGVNNTVFGDYAVVLGGSRNCAYQLAGTILGGLDNEVGGSYNAIVNGNFNCIISGTSNSVIMGGTDNIIDKDNIGVAILGGLSNRIAKNSSRSLILGGTEQVIGGEEPNMFGTVNYACGLKGSNACYSYIIGGYSNTIWSGNCYSTVLGGSNNQINAVKAQGKSNAPSTGWSHVLVSQSSRVCSNLSFVLAGDSAVIETGANRSFVVGANATVNAPYSFVIGGTAVNIPVGHDCSAVISQTINNRNVTSRGAKTLLLNFDSGVYISDKLSVEGGLVLPYFVTPTKSISPGEKGQIAVDENFIYVCDRPNHWVRTALAEWDGSEAKPGGFEFYLTTYQGNYSAFDQDVRKLGFNIGNLVTRNYPTVNFPIPTSYVTESGFFNNSSATTVRPLFSKNANSINLEVTGVTWTIDPPLFGGLHMNPQNGQISGFVTGISYQTGIVYTITASNSAGSSSKQMGIWYYPLVDSSIALIENEQKQITTYWVQGCGFGCGCQGGVGYYATTTVAFYVIDTNTLNDLGDIRIRTFGVVSPNINISYSIDNQASYTGDRSFKSFGNYSPIINYNIPYLDQNIHIRFELYNTVTGSPDNTIYTYIYNPVKAESNY